MSVHEMLSFRSFAEIRGGFQGGEHDDVAMRLACDLDNAIWEQTLPIDTAEADVLRLSKEVLAFCAPHVRTLLEALRADGMILSEIEVRNVIEAERSCR